MKNNLTGIDEDKLISYEIMGEWPIYKLTLREILSRLGAFETPNGIFGFDSANPILDICPCRLTDDGMGYGVNEEWIIDADSDNKNYINIFTEKELPQKELDNYLKRYREVAQKIKEWYGQLELSKR